MYFAIAGNPEEDYTQGFKHVIKDQEFYDEHVYEWFPNPNIKDKFLAIKDKKKLLGLCIENQGNRMIALAPKCYTIEKDYEEETEKGKVKVTDLTTKSKGINKDHNKLKFENYSSALKDVIPGKNVNMQLDRRGDDYQMSIKIVHKNALTGAHTKMVVLENQSCCPFGFDEYIIDDE